MSKKLAVNKFSVLRNGSNWLAGLTTYDDAMTVVNYLLASVNFTDDEVTNTIIAEYTAKGYDVTDELKLLRYMRAFWFKPNRFGVTIKAITTSQVVEIPERLDLVDNKLIESTKSFNGKSLRHNTIEEPSKWKPHLFQAPEIWYAMSVQRHKGLTTLPRTKVERQGNAEYVGQKITKQPDHGEFRLPIGQIYIDTIIRELRALHVGAVECHRKLRNQFSGSNRELKRLIMDIYHE